MLDLSRIFTPDLFVLWLIAALIYALLHLCLAMRITRLQAYALGLGTCLALGLAHAWIIDAYFPSTHLEYAVGSATIAVVAGLVTQLCWFVRKPEPPEPDGVMGQRRLTNKAMAYVEGALIDAGIARESVTEALNMLTRQQIELCHLRNMKASDNVLGSIQQQRHKIALEIAKELEQAE